MIDSIQQKINNLPDIEKGKISDGYHTFDELYEHRCVLWICLINNIYDYISSDMNIIKTQKHYDGTSWDGWFLSLYTDPSGNQMSYHLPMKYWDNIVGEEYQQSPYKFDGHSSDDVLERLKSLFFLKD
jgi:hypothetical protein